MDKKNCMDGCYLLFVDRQTLRNMKWAPEKKEKGERKRKIEREISFLQ